MPTPVATPKDFPSAETFRSELIATLAVSSRKEVADLFNVTPQGVGLWDRGVAVPPARRRTFLIGKLQAMRVRKGRKAGAKC
jgi:hypothetical protein